MLIYSLSSFRIQRNSRPNDPSDPSWRYLKLRRDDTDITQSPQPRSFHLRPITVGTGTNAPFSTFTITQHSNVPFKYHSLTKRLTTLWLGPFLLYFFLIEHRNKPLYPQIFFQLNIIQKKFYKLHSFVKEMLNFWQKFIKFCTCKYFIRIKRKY